MIGTEVNDGTNRRKGTPAIRLRAPVRWIVLVHFVLVSAIAQGTMPVPQAAGFAIVVCTGNGPVTLLLGPDGDPIEPSPSHDPCEWAAHGQGLALPPAAAVMDVDASPTQTVDPTPRSVFAGRAAPQQNLIRAPPRLL